MGSGRLDGRVMLLTAITTRTPAASMPVHDEPLPPRIEDEASCWHVPTRSTAGDDDQVLDDASAVQDCVTGYESLQEARETGWLGQVPPPTIAPPETHSHSIPPLTTYANPQLGPDPWMANPVLPGTDPTLFG